MSLGPLESDGYYRQRDASWKLVKKYGVFDIKGSTIDYQEEICDEQRPCPVLVSLYAKMGLHRYNLLDGTKFVLSGVKRYVKSKGTSACCYYITMDAMDPAVGSSLQTFQTEVSEQSFGRFILMCYIARIRGVTSSGRGASFVDSSLPEWPAENPFDNYNLVKESDTECIRLYMELAVAIVKNSQAKDYGPPIIKNRKAAIVKNRKAKDYGPPKLEIVKAAMDANDEGLNAINAIFYVRYKDLYEAEIGKALDRFAIVRRRFHENTQCFSLVGSQVTPNVGSQMKVLHL